MSAYPFKSVYTFANNFCGFCIDIVNVTGRILRIFYLWLCSLQPSVRLSSGTTIKPERFAANLNASNNYDWWQMAVGHASFAGRQFATRLSLQMAI